MQPVSNQTRITLLLQEIESPNARFTTDAAINEISARIFSVLKSARTQEEKSTLEYIVKRVNVDRIKKRFYEEIFCSALNSGNQTFYPMEIQNEVPNSNFPIFINYDMQSETYTAHYYNMTTHAKESFSVTDANVNEVFKKVRELKKQLQKEAVSRIEELAGKENVKGPMKFANIDDFNNAMDIYTVNDIPKASNYLVTYPAKAYENGVILIHHVTNEGIHAFPAPVYTLDYALCLVKKDTD